MNRSLVSIVALFAMLVGGMMVMTENTADAGLFGRARGCGVSRCGGGLFGGGFHRRAPVCAPQTYCAPAPVCQPKCCAPQPKCCQPKCCTPAPCCEVKPCCEAKPCCEVEGEGHEHEHDAAEEAAEAESASDEVPPAPEGEDA